MKYSQLTHINQDSFPKIVSVANENGKQLVSNVPTLTLVSNVYTLAVLIFRSPTCNGLPPSHQLLLSDFEPSQYGHF